MTPLSRLNKVQIVRLQERMNARSPRDPELRHRTAVKLKITLRLYRAWRTAPWPPLYYPLLEAIRLCGRR